MREDLSGNRELIENNYRWSLKKNWLHAQLFNCRGKNMPTWVGYCKTLSTLRCFKPEWIKQAINLTETSNVLLRLWPSWLLLQGSRWRSCKLKTGRATPGLSAKTNLISEPLQNTGEHTIYSLSGWGCEKYHINHSYMKRNALIQGVHGNLCVGICWYCLSVISPKALSIGMD